MALVDSFNRRIDYLRVSVTDRCNLRCKYCMPEGGITHRPPTELLSFEEIAQIVRVGVSLGIDKVRLTGGEPLVRKNIVDLVKILSSIRGLNDISMTTNGILLRNKVSDLKKAGLKRVNISLDSLNEERFKDISRGGELKEVTEAIKLSLEEGLSPLKINVLLLAGINEDEVNDFLRLAKEYPLHVRFMEFMPIRDSEFWDDGKNFMSCEDVMEIASQETLVEPIDVYGNGPARNFRFKGSKGSFGFITPMSERFCSSCNRLRLTSDGFLKACLHSEAKVNMKEPLRQGIKDEKIKSLFKLAASLKVKEHSLDKDSIGSSDYLMCQIGG